MPCYSIVIKIRGGGGEKTLMTWQRNCSTILTFWRKIQSPTRVNIPRFTDDVTTCFLFFFFINNRHRSVADDQYDQNFPPWGIRTDQPYLHFRGSTIVCNIWLAKNDCHLHVIACNKLNETDFYQTIAYLGRRNNVVEKTWIYQFIAKNLHLSYRLYTLLYTFSTLAL